MSRGRATRRRTSAYRTAAEQARLYRMMMGYTSPLEERDPAEHQRLVKLARSVLDELEGRIAPPTMMQNGEPWSGYKR